MYMELWTIISASTYENQIGKCKYIDEPTNAVHLHSYTHILSFIFPRDLYT